MTKTTRKNTPMNLLYNVLYQKHRNTPEEKRINSSIYLNQGKTVKTISQFIE